MTATLSHRPATCGCTAFLCRLKLLSPDLMTFIASTEVSTTAMPGNTNSAAVFHHLSSGVPKLPREIMKAADSAVATRLCSCIPFLYGMIQDRTSNKKRQLCQTVAWIEGGSTGGGQAAADTSCTSRSIDTRCVPQPVPGATLAGFSGPPHGRPSALCSLGARHRGAAARPAAGTGCGIRGLCASRKGNARVSFRLP